MLHCNVCSKMMEKGRNIWHPTCFFPSPSFYYIHCSEAWHLFQTHTFRSRQALSQWEAWNLFQMTSDGATWLHHIKSGFHVFKILTQILLKLFNGISTWFLENKHFNSTLQSISFINLEGLHEGNENFKDTFGRCQLKRMPWKGSSINFSPINFPICPKMKGKGKISIGKLIIINFTSFGLFILKRSEALALSNLLESKVMHETPLCII